MRKPLTYPRGATDNRPRVLVGNLVEMGSLTSLGVESHIETPNGAFWTTVEEEKPVELNLCIYKHNVPGPTYFTRLSEGFTVEHFREAMKRLLVYKTPD